MLRFFILLEALVALAIVALVVTQILVPLLRGTPSFPLFTGREERRLRRERERVEQARVEELIRQDVERARRGLRDEEETRHTADRIRAIRIERGNPQGDKE